MSSLDNQCRSASMIVFHGVLDDANWKPFGFRRRPRRGIFFNHFVPRKRLEKETVLVQELWGTFFAQISYWITQRRDFSFQVEFLARLFEFCLGDDASPLWPSIRFTSSSEAAEFLRDAHRDYFLAAPSDHASVFIKRCGDRLAQDLPKVWMLGAAWLFAHPASMLKHVGRALDESGVAENPASDIQVCNRKYFKLAQELIGQGYGHENAN
ncbi:MAG: hypothetical protein DRP65_05720 [Planctomycetota bacterium]|nr:MAG: hypothetical protein DRP65_05720 [Planctomycetota bacterium]